MINRADSLPTGLETWAPLLGDVLTDGHFSAVMDRVSAARRTATVYPPEEDMFTAFALTPPERVRAVILGQDPYHEEGQAYGLAFSVRKGIKIPPSLRNIYQERQADLGIPPASHGCLTPWAEEGVFLLNTVLTVEQGKANSHSKYGWQEFTDGVIAALGRLEQPIAVLLWGAQAWKKESLLDSPHPRLILKSVHPSPLSAYRGFFGSRPFSQVNEFLMAHGQPPIDWQNE